MLYTLRNMAVVIDEAHGCSCSAPPATSVMDGALHCRLVQTRHNLIFKFPE